MWIQQCTDQDILEFDSMDELKVFDLDYIYNNRVRVFENICRVLCCEITDIQDMSTIKKGLNNQSFKFQVNGEYYIYRHPGINASGVIDERKKPLRSGLQRSSRLTTRWFILTREMDGRFHDL